MLYPKMYTRIKSLYWNNIYFYVRLNFHSMLLFKSSVGKRHFATNTATHEAMDDNK